MTTANPPTATPRRRWRTLSVRGLMILVLLAGGLTGWEVNRVTRLRQAMAVLEREVVPAADLSPADHGSPADTPLVDLIRDESAATKTLRSLGLGWALDRCQGWLPEQYFDRVIGLSFSRRPTAADWDAIRALGSVEELDFAGVPLDDADLARLADAPGLLELDLSDTAITDRTLAKIPALPHLQVLLLEETPISTAGLVHLKNLVDLEELTLPDAIVAGGRLGHLRDLRNLKLLKPGRVSDEGLAAIKNLEQLEDLEFAAWHVTDRGWMTVTGFPYLKRLHISRGLPSPLEGLLTDWLKGRPVAITPAGFATIGRLVHLEDLTLEDIADDPWLPTIGRLTQLRQLRLTGRGIGGGATEAIGRLAGLTSLALNSTGLGDADLIPLGRLPNLEELTLRGSAGVTDAGLRHLAPLTRLTSLTITGSITPAGIAALRATLPGLGQVHNLPLTR